MEFRLADRPLQAEHEAVVVVRGIVDAILIEDQRLGERADLEEPVPVGRIPSEPGDLETHDNAGAPQPDVGDETLESIAKTWAPGLTYCALATGAAEPLVSALRYFRSDFERHIAQKRCPWK